MVLNVGVCSLTSHVWKRTNQVLHDAWHKKLCHRVKGNVMECPECKKQVSTTDIVNLALVD